MIILVDDIIDKVKKRTNKQRKTLFFMSNLKKLKEMIFNEEIKQQQKEMLEIKRNISNNFSSKRLLKVSTSTRNISQVGKINEKPKKLNIVVGKGMKQWKPEYQSQLKNIYKGKFIKFSYCENYDRNYGDKSKICYSNLYDYPKTTRLLKLEDCTERPRTKGFRALRKNASSPELITKSISLLAGKQKVQRSESRICLRSPSFKLNLL